MDPAPARRGGRGNRRGHLPVILITAWTDVETAVAIVREGADDYIAKPWNDADRGEEAALRQAQQPLEDQVDVGARGPVVGDAAADAGAAAETDRAEERRPLGGQGGQDAVVAGIVERAQAEAHARELDRGHELEGARLADPIAHVEGQLERAIGRALEGAHAEGAQGAPDLEGAEPARQLRSVVHEVDEQRIAVGGEIRRPEAERPRERLAIADEEASSLERGEQELV